jgi:hypothetical protein
LVSIFNGKPPFFSAASRTARRAVLPRERCRLVVAVVVAYNRTRSRIFGKSYSSQASPRIGSHSRREQPPASALGWHSREDRLQAARPRSNGPDPYPGMGLPQGIIGTARPGCRPRMRAA